MGRPLDGLAGLPALLRDGRLIVNFDQPFWEEPVVYAYGITIRPGRIKGWGMHKL
jgi:hypothetical protein